MEEFLVNCHSCVEQECVFVDHDDSVDGDSSLGSDDENEEADAEPDLLKQLKDEIISSIQSKQRKAYNCCLTGCTFKTGVHSLYVKHLKLESHMKVKR